MNEKLDDVNENIDVEKLSDKNLCDKITFSPSSDSVFRTELQPGPRHLLLHTQPFRVPAAAELPELSSPLAQ